MLMARMHGNKKKFEFETEFEFFLHLMWSQKGYDVEDNTDEYGNMQNVQSDEYQKSHPQSAATSARFKDHMSTTMDP